MPPFVRSTLFGTADLPITPLSMYDSRYNHHFYLRRLLRVASEPEGERELSAGFCFFISAIVAIKRDPIPLHCCQVGWEDSGQMAKRRLGARHPTEMAVGKRRNNTTTNPAKDNYRLSMFS